MVELAKFSKQPIKIEPDRREIQNKQSNSIEQINDRKLINNIVFYDQFKYICSVQIIINDYYKNTFYNHFFLVIGRYLVRADYELIPEHLFTYTDTVELIHRS